MLTTVYPLCSRFAATLALAGGLALAAVAQAQQVEEKLFRLPDGAQAWSYSFSKGQPHPVLPENWIFVVAGSGCAGLQAFLPAYFRGLGGESGLTRFFILQKRGIAPADDGKQCSEAFIRAGSSGRSGWPISRRSYAASCSRRRKRPRRVILMGISEGAEVVAGWPRCARADTSDSVGAQRFRCARDLSGAGAAISAYARRLAYVARLREPPADPDAARIHGRSWRYWSELAAVSHLALLEQITVPVFWAYGGADGLIPDDARRKLQQNLSPARQRLWRVCEYAGADHGFHTGERSRLPDLMWQIERWLMAAPDDADCYSLAATAAH
jgi:hypothetical protein